MRLYIRLAPLLACLPLLATAASNALDRIELRCGTQVARVSAGQDEPADSGSYDVRVYDVTNGAALAFVDGLVLPRDGTVKKAWFCDLNEDGQPEIAIWVSSADADAYGQLDVLAFDEDGLLQEVEMPELTWSWKRGYRGHDVYRMEKGVIYRTFPVFRWNDANTPTGGERTLKLICEKDRWMWRLHAVK